MTDSDDALHAISRVAATLIPGLTERLRRYGLGEIEVEHGELRLRVSAAPGTAAQVGPREAIVAQAASDAPSQPATSATLGVVSPAVGFFVFADGLGPGLQVTKGDPLGHVEMLGVRHDVRAPRGGRVSHLVAESGEAVEYGQVVLELEAAETR